MKLTLFGMLNVDEKAKSPTRPNKKVPFHLFAIAKLLLLTNPINPERDEHHPRIDQKRDDDDTNNPRISPENSPQAKEKKEDDSCCKHSTIVEIQYNQMRYFLSDDVSLLHISINLGKEREIMNI